MLGSHFALGFELQGVQRHHAINDTAWCETQGACRYTPRGRAWNPNSPSLGATTNAAFLSAVYANLDSNQYTNPAKTQKYQCWSLSQTR